MKRLIVVAVICMMTASLAVGCGSSDKGQEDSGAGTGNETASDEKETVLTALVANDWENYGLLNDDGELEGYEVDVLKAVDEKVDSVKIDIQGIATDEMTPMLTQVAEGRADMAVCEFEYSEEREETYLFAQEGYNDFSTYLLSLKDSGYTSLESLAGATVANNVDSDPSVTVIQDYNEENPDKAVNLEFYGDVGADIAVAGLKEGKWDALLTSRDNVHARQEQFGDIFDVGDMVYSSEAYFLYTKDGGHEESQKAIDTALKELKDDGTLNQIHDKWFGFPAYEE